MVRVQLAPYDPAWADAFEAWKGKLSEVVGARARSIEHFGSTSIPGCAAKPIIDILVGRGEAEDFQEWRELLARVGLTHARMDSTGLAEGQWFFRDAARTVHVHVYEEGSSAHERHLRFRDALRGDPALKAEYVALKQRLAEREWAAVQEYADAKADFVCRVEAIPRDALAMFHG